MFRLRDGPGPVDFEVGRPFFVRTHQALALLKTKEDSETGALEHTPHGGLRCAGNANPHIRLSWRGSRAPAGCVLGALAGASRRLLAGVLRQGAGHRAPGRGHGGACRADTGEQRAGGVMGS